MANCYAHLGIFKDAGTLGLTVSTHDAQILRVAEQSSRMIDQYCDRFFYVYEGTLYEEGASNKLFLRYDVQTVSTMTVDADGDSSYESTYTLDLQGVTTAPDVICYPLNSLPKTRFEINPGGDYGSFGAGVPKAVCMVGTFGHGNDWPEDNYTAVGTVVASAFGSTDTTLTASTPTLLYAGMTLRLGSEQAYVSYTSSTAATVKRAVNGTSAAAAAVSTAIYVYEYPEPIVQACVIQTVRNWKRRESGFVNTIVNLDMGTAQVYKGLDPDVKEIINKYRKARL